MIDAINLPTSPVIRDLPLSPDVSPSESLTWLSVNKAAIDHNIEAYRSLIARPVQLGVVLKSNAYGHGMREIAALCQEHRSVDWLCMVSVQEALYLRKWGVTKPIIVLSILDGDLREAIEQNIDLIIYDEITAQKIAREAERAGKKAHVHLKIDTGLSRLGQQLNTIDYFAAVIKRLRQHLNVRGIFTHLADSEQADHSFVHQQLNKLKQAVAILASQNVTAPLIHTSCSAAIGTVDDPLLSFVRLGIGLYGLWPSLENKEKIQQLFPAFSLKPALSWFTRVIQIKEIESDSFVGYDRTFQANRMTKIAVLPVGYWDGFDRGLSNKGQVLINGQLAPVRGRVAMNMMMIDVTDIISVDTGTPVTLLGDHEGIRAEEMAALCDTINYEIVTRINPLLPRIVI